MSIEAMAIVLNHSRARGAAKLVLLGIANHINPDNDGAWPSQAKLAGYANVSDRSVRDAIDNLVYLGELRYEVGAGVSQNQYKPNRYWLLLTCPPECDGTANHRARVEVSDAREEVSSSQGGSFQQSGWKHASDKPLREPLEEPKPYARQVERGDFEAFWKVYPRKAGKQAAAKAYAKALEVVAHDVMVAGALRYANDLNRHEAYTAHAATWLNAGRWDDEPLPERQLTKEERDAKDQAAREARWAADKERRAREALEREAEAKRIEETRASVRRCEHDRIIYACRLCAPKVLSEATT